MKKDRMEIIIENFIDHLSESLGHSNYEELFIILKNGIGMTEKEIDYFMRNLINSDFNEID